MAKRINLFFINALIISLILFKFFIASTAHAEESSELIIIANKNAPQSNLSKDEIQKIYTGKTMMWSSNEKINLAILKDDKVHKAFLKKYVKRNSSQFKNTWRQVVFTGKGDKPAKFDTIEELIAFVSGNRLAIGYITRNEANDNIKIITP